jgi:hypothetical protein
MGLPQGMKGTADSSDDDGGGSDDNDDDDDDDDDVDDGDRCKEKGLSPGPKSSHFGDHLQYMKLNDSRKEYTPPCLTIGRHPVDRAISYYYQRSFTSFDERIFNHLSVSEVIHFALLVVSATGKSVLMDDGPSNMMARAYSGIRNLTGKTYDWVNDSQMKVAAHSIISVEECGLAYKRLDRCVIGILEDMENTRQVLKHWFPWMQTFKSTHTNMGKRYSFMNVVDTDKNKIDVKETRHTIRPELREVLETANYCDMILYDRMKEIFKKQLQVLNASGFTA